MVKPEPIMLLILPIILSRIFQTFYPLFSMPSPISYSYIIFIVSVKMMSTIHTVADKWVHIL